MALDQAKNHIVVDLVSGINDTATSISLSSGDAALLPNPSGDNYNLVLWNSTDYGSPHLDPDVEIIRATNLVSTTLTIVRPVVGNSYNDEGTENTAHNHNTGGKVYSLSMSYTRKFRDDIDTELTAKLVKVGKSWGFTVGGELKVTSGQTDFLNGFYIKEPTGNTLKITGYKADLQSGTNVVIDVDKNGTTMTGYNNLTITTSGASATPTAIDVADGDLIEITVVSVSGTPENLAFTLFGEVTV